MTTAATVIDFVEAYAWTGLLVCIAFLGYGIDRIEPSARGSYLFRVLLVPGVMLLWPVVVLRWLALERGAAGWRARHSPRRRLHGRVWRVLAVVIALTLLAGFLARQDGPLERPATQIAPPAGAETASKS